MEAFGNRSQILVNTIAIPSDGSKNCFLPSYRPPPPPMHHPHHHQGLPQNSIRLPLKIKEGLATSEAIRPSSKVHFLPQYLVSIC